MNAVIDDAFDFSRYSGAWLSMWLGYALEMGGDAENASHFYRKSYANQSNMPRPRFLSAEALASVPEQVTRVAVQMRVGLQGSALVQTPKTLVQDLTPLNGNGSSAQVEQAIRCLGQYLGLKSSRPDKEFGTGPDVLWIGNDRYAVCIEVKTNKQETAYRKADVGQLHNHVQWVKDNHEVSEIIPAFVGPLLSASKEASPSLGMRVIELRQLDEIGQRLIAALQDVTQTALPLRLEHDLNEVMKNRSLVYPYVFSNLDASILRDI